MLAGALLARCSGRCSFALADASGLKVATARRILQALVAEGLLAFDSKSKVYSVGPAIYSLALTGDEWFARRDLIASVLDKVSRRTRDTVIFVIRSGLEIVCLARHEGAHPIRVLTLDTGSRRPLGVGSASLAILSFLPDAQRNAVLQQCDGLYEAYGLTSQALAKAAVETRRNGFAFIPGHIAKGVYGVAVPLLTDDVPRASISVAAIASRMAPARRQEILGILCEEAALLPNCTLPAGLLRFVQPSSVRAA